MTTTWKSCRLDELGFIGRGKSRHRPRNDPRLYGGPYPFIQTAEIMGADPYITGYSQTYTDYGLQQSKLWPPNTLCMTIAGANTAETAILKFEACFPDSIVGFIPDEKKADLHFVKYSLDLMKDKFRAVTRGATQDNLSLDKLLSFPLPMPPIPIQRQIAGILSAHDDLIENNTRWIKILEEMAQAIYREWFVHFRFPGHEKIKMVNSPLGKIPEGWAVCSLGQLCELRKDKYRENKDSGLPLLDLAKMPQRTLSVGEMGNPQELSTSRTLFEEDDILFGSIRPYLHKVVLALCRGVTNVSVLVIRPAAPDFRAILSILLSSEDSIRWADQHSTGTKMPVIKWDIFRKMPVLKPEQSLLQRFHNLVQPMLQTIKMASSRNQNLRRTRDLLLPKLISGEVDVSKLDIEASPSN